MAKVLNITRDSYYKWIKRKQSRRKQENEFLLSRIRYIFNLHKKRYGSSRIYAELLKENTVCSRRRVAKLMKSANLVSIRYKRHKYPKNSDKPDKYPPNLLNQNFTLKTENTVMKAFNEAITKRKPKENLIFHSDRGIQYHSEAFRNKLRTLNITQSANGKGNCYDNAVA